MSPICLALREALSCKQAQDSSEARFLVRSLLPRYPKKGTVPLSSKGQSPFSDPRRHLVGSRRGPGLCVLVGNRLGAADCQLAVLDFDSARPERMPQALPKDG